MRHIGPTGTVEHPCQCGGECGLTFKRLPGMGWRRKKYAPSCPVMRERELEAGRARKARAKLRRGL